MSPIRVAYVCAEPERPLVAALRRAGATVDLLSMPEGGEPPLELADDPFDLVLVDRAALQTRVAEWLKGRGGAHGGVHLAPRAIDPARFPLGQRATRPAPLGTFTVGFAAPLRAASADLEVVAESFRLMREVRPGFRLLVVGDGPARAELESRLAARPVLETVEMTGPVQPAEVPGLLASMDAAVVPYPLHAGSDLSRLPLYEGMAAGLPVVASGHPPVEDAVRHRVNGLLCPPGDAPAFAAALLDLADKPALRAALGREARRTALAEHTWTRAAERLLERAGAPSGETRVERGAAALAEGRP